MSTNAAAPAPAAPSVAGHAPRLLFGVTILFSACLLFLVQPLISKLILPWFGGSAAVWITSMLFFQTGLLAGYFYAHLLTRRLPLRKQALTHGILLLVSIAVLPILPNPFWQPKPGEDPTWKLLAVLATSVGLPYALLSSTSPLLQNWYATSKTGSLPYRYFALSNAGSMVALLAYPIAVEPFLKGRNQAWFWSVAYFLFAVLCMLTAREVFRLASSAAQIPAIDAAPAAEPLQTLAARPWVWIPLAACASTLLLTVTNYLTQNIAPMPLLWVIPLSLYLLSFILCFESGLWYQRWLFLPLLPFALWWLASHTVTIEQADVAKTVPLICASLFVCCMVCHGELAKLKPAADRLTSYYLCISIGGALGGVFVALVAPRVFATVAEYPISVIAVPVVVLLAIALQRPIWKAQRFNLILEGYLYLMAVGLVALSIYSYQSHREELENAVTKARNFYGALLVENVETDGHKTRQLSHGTITHGVQMLDANYRHVPTTYYGRESGAGVTWRILEKQGPIKLGVVGLGAGTMSAYGRAGDTVRFYDLNPLVVNIAKKDFTFLADCPAHVDIVMGDARLSLAHESSQQFDMLVIDAFAGDAVPVHLLTSQAFDIYWRHLKPDGVLAVHISNQYLNLAPIVALDAKARSLPVWLINNDAEDTNLVYSSDYVLVSKRGGFFSDPLFAERLQSIEVPRGMRRWTDDFTSLWPILNVPSLKNR